MALPKPVPGLVIRYSYLWMSEHRRGAEEGVKDRPCAIVLTTAASVDGQTVVVLPITHIPPSDVRFAIEIPHSVKRRLGLDDERSWVVLSEANRFIWPGPDLRPVVSGDASTIAYGQLPYRLFEQIRQGFVQALRDLKASTVARTE